MVDQSLGGPRPMDPAHGFFSSEINPKFRYFGQFALKPLGFSKINLQSKILSLTPEFEIFLQKVPSLRKIHKNSSKTSKIHIPQPQLQIQ
jgi:hypothetical protein